jgi:hypothetical protein
MFIILYAGQHVLGVGSTLKKLQNGINTRKLHGERNVFKEFFEIHFFFVLVHEFSLLHSVDEFLVVHD